MSDMKRITDDERDRVRAGRNGKKYRFLLQIEIFCFRSMFCEIFRFDCVL